MNVLVQKCIYGDMSCPKAMDLLGKALGGIDEYDGMKSRLKNRLSTGRLFERREGLCRYDRFEKMSERFLEELHIRHIETNENVVHLDTRTFDYYFYPQENRYEVVYHPEVVEMAGLVWNCTSAESRGVGMSFDQHSLSKLDSTIYDMYTQLVMLGEWRQTENYQTMLAAVRQTERLVTEAFDRIKKQMVEFYVQVSIDDDDQFSLDWLAPDQDPFVCGADEYVETLQTILDEFVQLNQEAVETRRQLQLRWVEILGNYRNVSPKSESGLDCTEFVMREVSPVVNADFAAENDYRFYVDTSVEEDDQLWVNVFLAEAEDAEPDYSESQLFDPEDSGFEATFRRWWRLYIMHALIWLKGEV